MKFSEALQRGGHYTGSWEETVLGVFTPWKLPSAANQRFSSPESQFARPLPMISFGPPNNPIVWILLVLLSSAL